MPESKSFVFSQIISALIFLVLVAWTYRTFLHLEYEWDFAVLLPYVWSEGRPGLVLQGLMGTVTISVISIFFGSVVGVLAGLALCSQDRILKFSARGYVEVFRNTPVLVHLYVAFFVVGAALNLSAWQAGVLTLSLFCGSQIADIVRGTLHEFEKGQIDAALSLGLTRFQIGWLVIAPQALRRMLPALVGQFVALLKDSSLVSVIGIIDLTKSALNIVAVTFKTFEVWFSVAVIYMVLNFFLSTVGRKLEDRLRKA